MIETLTTIAGLVILSGVLVSASFVAVVYAQEPPLCPVGEIPETDINGDPVRDPETDEIVCIPGPT